MTRAGRDPAWAAPRRVWLALACGIVSISISAILIRYGTAAPGLALAAWRTLFVSALLVPAALVRARGEMAAFVRRARGLPVAPETFVDVSPSDTFVRDLGAIQAAGITRGCNPPAYDRFCPDEPVTRQQMAVFVVRAWGL